MRHGRGRSWGERARRLKADVHALALACRDPRVPWYARALAVVVVGYALSPIDLIPDPIPVLGYLDDLVLLPLGVALVLRLIPTEVMAEHRAAALAAQRSMRPKNWIAAGVIIVLWIAAFVLVSAVVLRYW